VNRNTPRPPRVVYNVQPSLMEDYSAAVFMLSMVYRSYKMDVCRRIFRVQNDNVMHRIKWM
jgi:hypothetical protein